MSLLLKLGAKIVVSVFLTVANVVFTESFGIAGTGTTNILVITGERHLVNLLKNVIVNQVKNI
jgi:hypothetical protein